MGNHPELLENTIPIEKKRRILNELLLNLNAKRGYQIVKYLGPKQCEKACEVFLDFRIPFCTLAP